MCDVDIIHIETCTIIRFITKYDTHIRYYSYIDITQYLSWLQKMKHDILLILYRSFADCRSFTKLGNLPIKRAKDAVCFLQRCGVSLVWSYAVCFMQWGGVSLASSAIIYNIVKVKVTRWPIDLLEKEPLNSNCEVHLLMALRCSSKRRRIRLCCRASKRHLAAVWREAGAYVV